jgi:hypothetical protein
MRKSMIVAALALLLCLTGGNAQSPQVQAWLKEMPEGMKDAFMSGYMRGFHAAALVSRVALDSATPAESRRVFDALQSGDDCQLKMTAGQLTAIINKFTRDHPEKWDQDLASLILLAMGDACASRQGK